MTLDEAKQLDIPRAIETPRMMLRAVVVEHVKEVFEAVSESIPDLSPWMPWVHPTATLEGSRAFHEGAQQQWNERTMLDFTWFDKVTQSVVGKGGFHTINWQVPKFEIGYWVRSSRAGEGLCTEAVQALVEFGQVHLGANRLEITSDPRNVPSRRVAEKSGFILEGILRKNMPDPMTSCQGGLRDSCMYAWVRE
jgi:ribosomal-protein-serine acetyltransferase